MRKHKRIPGNDRYRIYVDGKVYDKLNRKFLNYTILVTILLVNLVECIM